jgi:hypothetical protein
MLSFQNTLRAFKKWEEERLGDDPEFSFKHSELATVNV